MKKVFVIMVVVTFFLLTTEKSFSQSINGKFQTTIIEPYSLKITLNKTTNLIFPYPIKSVDRGSADVLAQKAKGMENILLVKAGKENFSETNLSVITADGNLYSFVLDYSNNPSVLNLSFADTIKGEVLTSLKPLYNEVSFKRDAGSILNDKKRIRSVNDYRYQVRLSLNGIYIKDDVLFLKVEVANISNIDYDVEMLRFFITDEKKSKRTATQEIEIQPAYVYGNTLTIKGKSKNAIVIALPKFTIPDKKYLSVELMENNGGRNLKLSIHNSTILKAKALIKDYGE